MNYICNEEVKKKRYEKAFRWRKDITSTKTLILNVLVHNSIFLVLSHVCNDVNDKNDIIRLQLVSFKISSEFQTDNTMEDSVNHSSQSKS